MQAKYASERVEISEWTSKEKEKKEKKERRDEVETGFDLSRVQCLHPAF